MKVTPLEIRQKTFERTLRGYDKDEVNAFLLTLSQEWERMSDEVKELKVKLEISEREIAKLREVETSLFKTLKTAEDTGANVIDQAKKAAELHFRESQIRAEAMLNEAKDKAKNTLEETDVMCKQLLGDLEDNLKELVHQYKTAESHRNNLVDDLRRLGNELTDRAERAKQGSKHFNADDHLAQAKREIKKSMFSGEMANRRRQESETQVPVQPAVVPKEEPARSFFDEVA